MSNVHILCLRYSDASAFTCFQEANPREHEGLARTWSAQLTMDIGDRKQMGFWSKYRYL